MRHGPVTIDPQLGHDEWEITPEATELVQTTLSEIGELTSKITHIVSSNELKAIQTAKLVGNELSLPTSVDKRFRELDLGEFFSDFEAFKAVRMRQFEDIHYQYKSAETPAEGLNRFEKGLSEQPSGALVVSHGTILTTYLNSIQKRSIEHIQTAWNNMRFCAWAYIQDSEVKRFLA